MATTAKPPMSNAKVDKVEEHPNGKAGAAPRALGADVNYACAEKVFRKSY